jgi:hypothetical protein
LVLPIFNLIFLLFLLLKRVGFSGRGGRLWARLGQIVHVELIPEGTECVRLVERGGGATVEGNVKLWRIVHSVYTGPSAPRSPMAIYGMKLATIPCIEQR